MKCSNCDHKNPPGLEFCEKCTVQLKKISYKSNKSRPLKRLKRPKPPKQFHPGYPYPPPYQYPYPYPPHLFPSLYGHIYEKPPERSRLRFDILPKILFKPKSAFKEIYPHTYKGEGLAMVFVLTLIYIFIQIAFYSANNIIFGSYGSITTNVTDGYALLIFTVSIPSALITVSLIGFISAKISKEMRGGRDDVDKTIGLLGYANVVNIVWGSITMVIIHIIFMMEFSNDYIALPIGYRIMFGILALIGFIWSLIVNGYAIAIANNISLGRGIILYFIFSLLVAFFIMLFLLQLSFIATFIIC